jgi:30S ribosomal protein S31
MGRGDKKTAKGKRFKGSFGKSRPHKIVIAKKIEEKAS